MCLSQYFMKRTISSLLLAHYSPKGLTPSVLHDMRLSSYLEVINPVLDIYTAGDVIADAVKYSESYRLSPIMTSTESSVHIYN